ncbi:nuclease [Hyphomicrobium nitrativorans NL23]|uniref:Nuclease n=1 Tax=Hyphomicrobium nitrativorans NL23 TaxID=1029756 RepID=V5S9I1_9HYPH|nr:thermonuclease family protein [Hyphomicrobium nitrativorans]AHB47396.1 nuclease [Hyphomicrobium nitrativorans NL23]
MEKQIMAWQRRNAAVSGLVAVACLAVQVSAAASESCAPDLGTTHEVVRVIDGETVELDDGRQVRLIGAMAPRPNALTVDTQTWPPAKESTRAVEALVLNRTVTLRYEGRRRDRYGRILAQLYVKTGGNETWVQRHLVAEGYARAYTLPGNAGCVSELIKAEDEARRARRGLWSGGTFRVFAASDEDALLRLVGRFVVVEGRVASVTRTRRYTYLNFGRDWREDFTVSLATRVVDRAEGGAERISAIEGRTIRARGWIERRNGPAIEVGGFEEIEVLDAPPAADAADAWSPPPSWRSHAPHGRGEGLEAGGSPTADGLGTPLLTSPRRVGDPPPARWGRDMAVNAAVLLLSKKTPRRILSGALQFS